MKYPGPTNGGTLSTAGNLVFQGTAGGEFRAYAADTGKQLWSFPTQTGVVAGPITYSVAGAQYVAVLAGWGGGWDLIAGVLAGKSGSVRNISRLLVFKLDGAAELPRLRAKALGVCRARGTTHMKARITIAVLLALAAGAARASDWQSVGRSLDESADGVALGMPRAILIANASRRFTSSRARLRTADLPEADRAIASTSYGP